MARYRDDGNTFGRGLLLGIRSGRNLVDMRRETQLLMRDAQDREAWRVSANGFMEEMSGAFDDWESSKEEYQKLMLDPEKFEKGRGKLEAKMSLDFQNGMMSSMDIASRYAGQFANNPYAQKSIGGMLGQVNNLFQAMSERTMKAQEMADTQAYREGTLEARREEAGARRAEARESRARWKADFEREGRWREEDREAVRKEVESRGFAGLMEIRNDLINVGDMKGADAMDKRIKSEYGVDLIGDNSGLADLLSAEDMKNIEVLTILENDPDLSEADQKVVSKEKSDLIASARERRRQEKLAAVERLKARGSTADTTQSDLEAATMDPYASREQRLKAEVGLQEEVGRQSSENIDWLLDKLSSGGKRLSEESAERLKRLGIGG